jgi:hypothetical protein
MYREEMGMNRNVIFIICAVLFTPFSLSAGVRINGIGFTYPTIQEAVNASVNGDRLHVSTGLYVESLVITNRHITIAGGYMPDYIFRTNDADTTVVNGLGGTSTIIIDGNSVVVLDTLEVTGGSGLASGGILVAQWSALTAQVVNVVGNLGIYGGGIGVADNAQAVVRHNSYIAQNQALIGGGMIGWGVNSILIFEGPHSAVTRNTAWLGAGISMNGGIFVQRSGGYVFANLASVSGGGISLINGARGSIEGPDTYVGGPAVLMNQATNGNGAGIYLTDSSLAISGPECYVGGNYCTGNGGGIFMTNSTLTVTDGAQFGFPTAGNVAFDSGGGIYAENSYLCISNDIRMTRCLAGTNGGGIYVDNSTLRIYDSLLGNTNASNALSAKAAGGILALKSDLACTRTTIMNNSAETAGGVYIARGSGRFNGCSFIRNTATNIGAVIGTTVDVIHMSDCSVISNHATSVCGGIYLVTCGSVIISNNSRIAVNTAEMFGGTYIVDAPVKLINSEVYGNRVNTSYAGIFHSVGHLDIIDSHVYDNHADLLGTGTGVGGGITVLNGTLSVIAQNDNCIIEGNHSAAGGGMLLMLANADISTQPPYHCLFQDNTAVRDGGGMFAYNAVTAMISGNVIFKFNHAGFDGGGICASNNCSIQLLPAGGAAPQFVVNISEWGGGGVKIKNNCSLTARNSVFRDNVAYWVGGGLSAEKFSSVTIDSDFQEALPGTLPPARFIGNHSLTNSGGGLQVGWDSVVSVQEALFASNSAAIQAGGIMTIQSTCRFENIVVVHNSAVLHNRGIVNAMDHYVEYLNSTIAYNGAVGIAGGSTPVLESCIVWGHSDTQVVDHATATFCDIQGGFPGAFNITNDPLFANAALMDFQLLEGSPCIDTGASLAAVTNDCIGNPRPYDGGWDMGAYEFIPEPLGVWVLLLIPAMLRKMNYH